MVHSRRIALLAAALAGLLVLGLRLMVAPTPFFADDLNQWAYLADGDPNTYSFGGTLDLFRFLDNDAATTQHKMAVGDLPWRFDASQRFAFWRPVASALMWVDYQLFGASALLAHLHSFAWFALLLALLGRFYARILPGGAAAVGVLAAIASTATTTPLMWWSARNALLAAVFAVLTLDLLHRWRAQARARWLGAAMISLALCLLSAESGMQAMALAGAYLVVAARGNLWRAGVWCAAPLAVFAAYLGAWVALGYGSSGSALYVSPFAEPAAYVHNLLAKYPTVLQAAFLNVDLPARAGAGALLLAAVLAAGATSAQRRQHGGAALWLVLGVLLALIPCFGGRNVYRPWTLVIPQIAAHALLGLLIAAPWSDPRPGAWRAARRAASLLLALVCLLLPLPVHWDAGTVGRRAQPSQPQLAAQFPPAVRSAITPGVERLVFLRAPVTVMPVSRLRHFHRLDGLSPQLSTLVLSDTGAQQLQPGDLTVTRSAANRLLVRGAVPLVKANDVYRYDDRVPFAPGDQVAAGEVTAAIVEVRDGRPTAVEFTFPDSLDGDQVVLLTWSTGAYRLVEPPPVGATISP